MPPEREVVVNIRKVFRRRVRHEGNGVNVAADINAVVSANVNEPGSRSSVRSRQRIVQRSGRVPEHERGGGERNG
jgi:hypothetical protein